MRTFANLFLFFFAVDGIFSLLDDLLNMVFDFGGLSQLRNLNAFATLVLAGGIFLSLGIDRRLPKRVFLPLLVFLLWSTSGCWPLSGWIRLETLGLFASLLQLLLSIAAFAYLRWRSGHSLQLTADDFSAKPFSLANTLGYFASTLFALPFILGFLLLAAISQQIEATTAGFMRVGPTGLYMKERTYTRENQQVRLTAMIHVGEKDYYRQFAESVAERRTLVLLEGVSDESGLLKQRFDYGDLGSALGLATQQEMAFEARTIDLDELGTRAWSDEELNVPHQVRADVDLSSFDPLTVEFLNVLGKVISSHGHFQENYAAYERWMEGHMNDRLYETVLGDILDKRNTVLIDHLATALKHYDTVIVPWGAMHMPAIEDAVIAQGFTLSREQERQSLDFSSLSVVDLVRRLGEQAPARIAPPVE